MKKILLILFAVFFTNTMTNAQIVRHLEINGKEKEIFILISKYKNIKRLTKKDKVKTPQFKKINGYQSLNIIDKKLAYLIEPLSNTDTVIMKLKKFIFYPKDGIFVKEDGCHIKALLYKTDDYLNYKTNALKTLESCYKPDSNTSYVIIYRPNYSHSFADMYNYKLTVNYNINYKTYNIYSNCKHVLKFNKETVLNLSVNRDSIYKRPVKLGKTYYVRCDAIAPPTPQSYNSITIPLNGYTPLVKIIDNEIVGFIESNNLKKFNDPRSRD